MSYSVPDLRSYVSGTWAVERTMLDRSTGATGTFTGTAVFAPRFAPRSASSKEATDDGALLQSEHGTVRWGNHEGPATREYVWRPTSAAATMDVFFPDGRFFHRVSFSGDSSGLEAEHWCDPDDYRVSYTVLGPDQFRYVWAVRGPAKDLLLTSSLTRRS
ncbi:DUF6314 family protein [Sinomonas humi]|uniref:DUF6314 domain-containing protein n=1 Tax=Sinomonas humi TaxID=1338436 RepID=A0A0B2APV6_9MICC|nr:DUF6314 family protein [Sinomonas humi]KHL03888.1 hypothetical protein LK10_08180 [Sinomonas humi]